MSIYIVIPPLMLVGWMRQDRAAHIRSSGSGRSGVCGRSAGPGLSRPLALLLTVQGGPDARGRRPAVRRPEHRGHALALAADPAHGPELLTLLRFASQPDWSSLVAWVYLGTAVTVTATGAYGFVQARHSTHATALPIA